MSSVKRPQTFDLAQPIDELFPLFNAGRRKIMDSQLELRQCHGND